MGRMRKFFRSDVTWTRRTFLGASVNIFLVLLALRAKFSFAQQVNYDFYISPTGSNNNSGAIDSPWAITALESKGALISGRRIGLLAGTYTLPVENAEDDYLSPVIDIAGGTSQGNTVVESVVPGAAIISGWNGSRYVCYSRGLIGTTHQYVTIRGIKVTKAVAKGIIIGNSNVLVENCEVYDLDLRRSPQYFGPDNTDGIRIEDYQGRSSAALRGVVVRNCCIHDIYNSGRDSEDLIPNAGNNACCIKIYRTGDAVIENCTLYNANEGVYAKTYAGGITVRYCHFYDIGSSVRTLSGNENTSSLVSKVHNNFFVNTKHYYDSLSDHETNHNLLIYNNTAYIDKAVKDGGGFYLRSARAGLVKTYNNIVYLEPGANTSNYGLGVSDRSNFPAQFSVLDYNCYAGRVMNWSSNMYTTIGSWRTAMANAGGAEAHSLTADPMFVSRGGASPADYKLRSGSPCIASGRVNGVATGAATNMGCWTDGVMRIGCDLNRTNSVKPNPPILDSVS